MSADKVVFTPNVPVEVALKFPDGRMVEGRFGNQMMYSLTDGRVMYLDLNVAAKINELEVQRGEVFLLCKRWTGKKGDAPIWDAWRPESELSSTLAQSLQVVNGKKNGNGVASSAAVPATGVTQSPVSEVNGSKPLTAPASAPASASTPAERFPFPKPMAASDTAVPTKIPMNRAVTEAVRMVQAAMKETGEQWSDNARQDLVSTILIGMQREGWLSIPDRATSERSAA